MEGSPITSLNLSPSSSTLSAFFPNSVSFGVFSHSKGLGSKWHVCLLGCFAANGFRLPKGSWECSPNSSSHWSHSLLRFFGHMAVASEKVLWTVPPTILYICLTVSCGFLGKWLLLQKRFCARLRQLFFTFVSQSPPGVKLRELLTCLTHTNPVRRKWPIMSLLLGYSLGLFCLKWWPVSFRDVISHKHFIYLYIYILISPMIALPVWYFHLVPILIYAKCCFLHMVKLVWNGSLMVANSILDVLRLHCLLLVTVPGCVFLFAVFWASPASSSFVNMQAAQGHWKFVNVSRPCWCLKVAIDANCCFKTQPPPLLRSLGVTEFLAFMLEFVLERLQQARGWLSCMADKQGSEVFCAQGRC